MSTPLGNYAKQLAAEQQEEVAAQQRAQQSMRDQAEKLRQDRAARFNRLVMGPLRAAKRDVAETLELELEEDPFGAQTTTVVIFGSTFGRAVNGVISMKDDRFELTLSGPTKAADAKWVATEDDIGPYIDVFMREGMQRFFGRGPYQGM